MNVLVFASRKGGSGKSTLAAHLASYIANPSRRTLLIDNDPQGSLSLWHKIRSQEYLGLRHNVRNIADAIRDAKREGYEWVLVDTPPNKSSIVAEAIKQATLVIIPTRASLFDIAALQDTVAIAREMRKPYAAVINAAPAKHSDAEAHVVADARGALNALQVPVWAGQITHRPELTLSLSTGEGAREYDASSQGADEIGRLWTALERSLAAIHNTYKKSGASRAA
ncbi:cobyrinic acid a,c-diamide synthase [Microvirga ossetica]|uniref:Cobyrinic acid a,c-diamide synthase n=1 Tax=Microvirga ossetica TaxID=1882682 RepID=A0A1B2EAM2_9HYPH|nr:ParA family protein [Microvirga ossetica]ANY77024.1 cobyrinic acid a,c-diamide synthase [Microvirga ossetica]